MVNAEGRRFLDEGADFRNYTYAKYGAAILAQPGGVAYQLFDATTGRCCAPRSTTPRRHVVEADVPREAGRATSASTRRPWSKTVAEFNASIDRDGAVRRRGQGRPARRRRRRRRATGRCRWRRPPFYAFPVTCGITFTFGGLHADTDGRVLTRAGAPIAGLFVCGEMLGGLFSGNYPGGTGLASGAVFGRRAGSLA